MPPHPLIHSTDHAGLKPPVIFLLLPPSTWVTGVKHHAQKWTFFEVGGKCCNLQSHSSGLTALLRQSHSVIQALGNSPASAAQVLAIINGKSNHALSTTLLITNFMVKCYY